MMYDIVIIGKGPAGISAALYAVRAGMKTLVIGSGVGMLEKAEQVDNYYGLEKSLSGTELQLRGEAQLAALGGELVQAEVTGIGFGEGYLVETATESFPCKAIIIAVGKSFKRVKIAGINEFEGKGVSYCAVCDGFFFKDKTLGVLGDGNYALQEAKHLAGFAKEITIFTNGKPFTATGENTFAVETGAVEKLTGQDILQALVLQDGSEKALDGLFVAVGQASAVDFAKKLGIVVENGNITVDTNGMTNMPGIFAAGDCIGGLNQMSTAVGEGAIAGQRAAEYVKKNR
ncbi:MAG TPA: NAD(P)/FAD-dependent oxidoreductase [Clostridia bacterium]|nr:NAD(P)/FAD-dependent oxidoreductase [Clostridia bacterium]